MQITVRCEDLLRALDVASIASKPIATLSNGIYCKVANDSLDVIGYNGNCCAQYTIDAQNIGEDGVFSLSADVKLEVFTALIYLKHEFVTIQAHDNQLILKHATGSITFTNPEANMDAVETNSNFLMPTTKPTFVIAQQLLGDALKKVSHATAKVLGFDHRYDSALFGVLLKGAGDVVTVVATDAFRMAKVSLEGIESKEAFRAVIPATTLPLLEKTLVGSKVEVAINNTIAIFKTENTKVWVELIDEEFPNYQEVIPTQEVTTVVLPVRETMQAMQHALLIRGSSIKITLENSKMMLYAKGDLGSLDKILPVDLSGGERVILVNPQYLSDALRMFEGRDSVTCYLSANKEPLILKEANMISLIMPMRY